MNEPIILHVPHASRVIPPDVRADIVLGNAELEHELDRMTDSFTDVIAARALVAPGLYARVVASPVSRLVVDVERFTDGSEPMEAVGMGAIYTRTHDGEVLRESIDNGLLDRYFHPHAAAMTDAVDEALAEHGCAVIIDVHSYPTERLPYEITDADAPRPEICIGTDEFHTPRWLLDAAREAFADFEIGLDSPFAGTYAPLKHYAADGRVASIMIEIRRDQYMDEDAVALRDGVERVVEAVARLMRCARLFSDRDALASQTDVVERARTLAIAAHEGQFDKADQPYWTHPERVARRVRELYPDAPDESVAAAWLHDVVEDTCWTASGLREVGFPDEVVDAVVLLTRTDDVPNDAYYAAIRSAGSFALMVKHADITDNLDEDRLAVLDPELAGRLRAKYAKALIALGLAPQRASAAVPPTVRKE